MASAALSMAGCQAQREGEPAIGLHWGIVPDPPAVGWATIALALTDSTTGRPVTDAAIELEANMTHPGMQPVFASGREIAPGRYESPLEFTMGGDWFILVHVTLQDGRTFGRQVDVRGVRAPGKP